MSIGRICGRSVVTATPDETVLEAARRMAEHDVGTLVVVRGEARPAGIVTDRDVTLRCVAAGLDPERTNLEAIMSAPIAGVSEATPIEDALSAMARSGTRRLVVTSADGALVGVVALDDVLQLLIEEVASIGRLLERSAPGRS